MKKNTGKFHDSPVRTEQACEIAVEIICATSFPHKKVANNLDLAASGDALPCLVAGSTNLADATVYVGLKIRNSLF